MRQGSLQRRIGPLRGGDRRFTIGQQTMNAQVHVYYDVESREIGPDWMLCLQRQRLYRR